MTDGRDMNRIGYTLAPDGSLTEEQRKWYGMGANDMEAGRLVTKAVHYPACNDRCDGDTHFLLPALTAEIAQEILNALCEHGRQLNVSPDAIEALSLIANGENDG